MLAKETHKRTTPMAVLSYFASPAAKCQEKERTHLNFPKIEALAKLEPPHQFYRHF